MDVIRPNPPEQNLPDQRPPFANLPLLHFVVMMVGVGCALLVSSAGGPSALWGKTTTVFSERDLDLERPQKQAEILLERAVSRDDGAAARTKAEIDAHIAGWRGKLKWDSQLGDLITVALNSNDQSVRASAIEVQLAAYGLAKDESTVDTLVRQANSHDHTKKIWALWTLGLLGNRGVETERVVQSLAAHLKDFGKNSAVKKAQDEDKNEDARRWAVEGLALVGATSTIAPLLEAMHNDPSAMVRERAACSLAESGMLSHQQRLTAVPQLISYSDDPALDAQTRGWAFQALSDITKQHLPNDSTEWRTWYQTSVSK